MGNYFSSFAEKGAAIFLVAFFIIPISIENEFLEYIGIDLIGLAYGWQYDDLKKLIESKEIKKDDEFLQKILEDGILTKNEYSRLIDYIENKYKDKKKKEFFEWLNGRK